MKKMEVIVFLDTLVYISTKKSTLQLKIRKMNNLMTSTVVCICLYSIKCYDLYFKQNKC